ncbi:4Fe-4S binding protein [Vibrio sp. ZSDZ34]|uniref:4Fe-4S binding protein n=1 Tax=Vibrio gelatinilyticus TaxID=2893468 RepID=A0A9X2AYE7_9VIBR|nr:4Fe-4S dicluster domain-containing protein [Vibrio gelatinilyticus]MCJ2376573.1 4Fe-4S binding protein [Vibrio gelatinilyticus]
MIKQLLQESDSSNGKARLYAIENTVELSNLIPPTVSYESQGDTLVIGPTSIITSIAEQLASMKSITLLSTDGESSPQANLYFADSIEVSGFLGTFTVELKSNMQTLNLSEIAISRDCFDIVLDHSLNGCMSEEVPVPGYYPVGRGYPSLTEALEEIPTLMGTFDKPKYFRLNTDLCAHSSRGIKGCERCVDACPAGALSSEGNDKIGHKIQINPYLCQGVGTCATACPTEAIHYALPSPQDTQKFIERTLENYLKAGGEQATILICSSRHETYNVMALRALPDSVIPIVVEELPSVGMDTWFAALVNGAHQVLFAASQHMPKTIINVLSSEVAMAQLILENLGMPRESIDILYLETLREGMPELTTQSFELRKGDLPGNKRQRLFSALDELNNVCNVTESIQKMPSTAPFGQVHCETDKCTLCMGCVAVCPTKALYNDGHKPALEFIEQDCVQCGMCEKACPEKALSLTPRLNWDQSTRQASLVIHEDKAAECTRCGKAFAPQSLIDMLQGKLRGHSQFNDEAAINRIAMCEDCRVIDVFESMAEDPQQQLKY